MIDIPKESEQIERLLDAQNKKELHPEMIFLDAYVGDPQKLLEDEHKAVEAHLEICATCKSLVNFRSDSQAQY